ncbi:MAG: hypothetical protein IT462_06620 [Planctomycetes bacterium]|nr:hypothetical protein [Planctomycetota bacterium]
MRSNMVRWGIGAASLIIAVVAALTLQGGSVRAADSANLTEKVTPGLVRMFTAKRMIKFEMSQWVMEDYKTKTTGEATRDYVAHDWFTHVSNGVPTEIVRSYEAITGKEKTKSGDMDAIELDAVDSRANNTIAINISGGKRTLKGEAGPAMQEKDTANALADLSPRLLPGKTVSVGDKWSVPADNLSVPYGCAGGEVIKSADCTVELKSFAEENGQRAAILAIGCKMTTYLEIINPYDDNASTKMTTEWEIGGEAAVDPDDGRLLALALQSKGTATGKMGGMNCSISGESFERNDYTYGVVTDNPVDNGSEGPDSVKETYTAKLGKIAEGHIVIARNDGTTSRLQVFDPSTGKIVKTLCALPKGIMIDDLAINAARDKIAFVSTGNSEISIADANVFTFETATAKINQITPEWATGDGLATALKSEKTGTITGRLVWRDTEENRDRSDGLNIGAVRVDHTLCFSTIGSDGRFEIKDVPVGASLFVYAWARLPNFKNGKPRHILSNTATGNTVLIMPEGNKDIGDLQIAPPIVDQGYMNPTFAGDSLWCNHTGFSTSYRVGLGKREWKQFPFGTQVQSGALSISSDGKQLCMVTDGSLRFFDTGSGSEIWSTGVAAKVGYNSSSAWLPGDHGCVVSGNIDGFYGSGKFGVPVLLYANTDKKSLVFARKWPQFTGSEMKSVAVAGADVAYFVLHTPDVAKNVTYGNLFKWDANTNIVTRLTSLNDVISVAALGR